MLIKILALPFKLIAQLFKHPRILVFGIFGVLIIFGLVNCSKTISGTGGQTDSDKTETQSYQDIAPDIQKARYVLQTSTRIYMIKKYELLKNESTILLHEYYTYDKNTWKLQTVSLPIEKELYGKIKLYDRETGKVLVDWLGNTKSVINSTTGSFGHQ